jgi:hypothetical protein
LCGSSEWAVFSSSSNPAHFFLCKSCNSVRSLIA